MNKNKSLLFIFILALNLAAPSTLLGAEEKKEKQGVVMGILGDAWWLGTSLCKSAYTVASTGYDLWDKHMTKDGFYAIVGGASIWTIYNYYAVIMGTYKKYKDSNRLCVWGIKNWDNHVRMRLNHAAVLAQLDSERPECADKANHRDRQRALNLKATITTELAELKRDMKSLEEQFLIFFKLVEYLPGCKALGIERNYKQLKQNIHGEEINWSEQQFNTLDRAMKDSSTMAWWHPLCLTLNYGNAAYVWWELKKYCLRLELLESWINPISEGKALFPNINNHNVGISHNEATFKPAVMPL